MIMKSFKRFLLENNIVKKIIILSEYKDSFGNNFISFQVKFDNGSIYEEDYKTTPPIISKFKWMIKNNYGFKAYQYIKHNGEQENYKKLKDKT